MDKLLKRSFDFDIGEKQQGDSESRVFTLTFSSEQPVERWFGVEILDHSEKSADLSRLNNGAALLFNHDMGAHIGVVERAWIQDRKGYATVRLGHSSLANEKFQDIKDGILKKVSFAYIPKNVVEEGENIYRVTEWEALEISFVTVPADDTVGLRDFDIRSLLPKNEEKKGIENIKIMEDTKMERIEEVKEILSLGEQTGFVREATDFVKNEKSIDEFRSFVIEKLQAKAIEQRTVDISEKEARNYSFINVVKALATGDVRCAEFEKEISDELSKKLKRDTRGFVVPLNVLKRDVSKGTGSAGGYLVANDLRSADFIDVLRNALVSNQLGVTMLDGLVGDITIPKQTASATTYWLAENGSVTKSTPTYSIVTLAPKTVAAQYYVTRKMMLQSSIAVENLLRNDLAKALAGAIDEALIVGSGASNQPTGILNTSGVNLVSIGTNGGALTYAKIVEMQTSVLDKNVTGNFKYLINAKVYGALKTTEKFSGGGFPILLNNEVDGFPAVITNAVPSNLTKGTGTNLSAVLFGDWSNALIGNWGVLEILPSQDKDTAGLYISVFQDVDIAVRYPEAFAVIKDAIA